MKINNKIIVRIKKKKKTQLFPAITNSETRHNIKKKLYRYTFWECPHKLVDENFRSLRHFAPKQNKKNNNQSEHKRKPFCCVNITVLPTISFATENHPGDADDWNKISGGQTVNVQNKNNIKISQKKSTHRTVNPIQSSVRSESKI